MVETVDDIDIRNILILLRMMKAGKLDG